MLGPSSIKTGLSDQQKEQLQIDLNEHEIEAAISQMAKGKAPGPDELSVDFYTQCCFIVKNDFVRAGSLDPSENEFPREVHSHHKFTDQGLKRLRSCKWISNQISPY